MSSEETLHDMGIREQQLREFILRSPEYLKRADREIKRQIVFLYLAIALLIVLQGLFTFREAGTLPLSGMILMSVTSMLAIVNCLLLIRTRRWLNRVNEAWLGPQEKVALTSLRCERTEIMRRISDEPEPATELG
jgi:hypothetical protein